MQGRAIHCAWANGVAANTLGDEISSNCLGQTDNRRLGGGVGETVRHALHAGCDGGHVDDCALTLFQHAWQEGAARAVHGLGIEIEGEIPVLFLAIENGAGMNETGAVEQNIRMADIGSKSLHTIAIQHVQNPRFRTFQGRERLLVDISGDDARAERYESLRRRTADTLAGCGDHHCPPVKILHHE